ncbi:hypothetical protein [Flaviflagellibacter deserti]|uniref:Uncharacterized protein n=1 Tax=Flaviflagellibacter deserti TaxID=2267266 RepID=A0ABV9YYR2_9HYPH
MRLGAFAASLLVATPAAALITFYWNSARDDAAAVCEQIIKRQMDNPSSYRQISAKVAGDRVLIEYDENTGDGIPVMYSKTCFFERSEDDNGWLPAPWKAIDEHAEALHALQKTLPAEPSLTAERKAQLRKQVSELLARGDEIRTQSVQDSNVVIELGLKPIPLNSTRLSQ